MPLLRLELFDVPVLDGDHTRRTVSVLLGLASLAATIALVTPVFGQDEAVASPKLGIEIPPDYRSWQLISVAHEEGKLNDLRAILGNDVAIEAARSGKLPYPDGTIIARLAWSYDPLPESAEAFGHPQSFVAGPQKNGVQFMVKDSNAYAATGGWRFAQFDKGNPAGEAVLRTCFPCHAIVQARDFVFNHYAP
jgi:hypothetical protein